MKVIVTGTTGFIGKRFVEMAKGRYNIVPASLRNNNLSNINLNGAAAIVHLAGKAHEMKTIDDQIFFDVNYALTRNLADKAVLQNVPHFIYASTTKVYDDNVNKIMNEQSECFTTDAYGKSKLMAEQYLQSLDKNKMAVAIVRPPLVYGPEVKGNMLRLLQLSDKNFPLPFANMHNARTMVFVDNLIEMIFKIIDQKASGTFVAADEKPLSTNELLIMIKKAMNKKPALFSLPKFVRGLLKKFKPDLYKRLFSSFVIDNTQTNKLLNFKPPYSSAFGIGKMVDWFKTLQ